MIDFENFISDLELVANLSSRFPDEELTVLQGSLIQFLPMTDVQLKRVKAGAESFNSSENNVNSVVQMLEAFGDVRFFYETIYWIALSVKKQADACSGSKFEEFYKNNLIVLINEMMKARIALSHIHFDELIKAEAGRDFKKIEKHLPEKSGLLFNIGFNDEATGIIIGMEEFIFNEDYKRIGRLKKLLFT